MSVKQESASITPSANSLTPDQIKAADRLYEEDATILVAETGVGKTVIALTAIHDLIRDGILSRVIVAAPPKVLANEVWVKEVGKWEHLKGLRVVQLEGSVQERKAILDCERNVGQVLMVSLNNLQWLLNQDHCCTGIIIDELSKAAGKQTAGLKSKKLSGMLKYRVGMTATPVSQNFEKFWAICRIIDNGAALGKNKSHYMADHFYSDYMGYNWTLKDGADELIMEKTASLVHLVADDKAKTLPPLREEVIRFDLSDGTREKYEEMKKHMVVDDVEAANQAVKSGKLRQLASGFLYAGNHDRSTEHYALERLFVVQKWARNLKGKPGLVFYEFIQQAEWADAMPENITFVQIASMSHGVDGLQHTFSDVLFLQPCWSRDQHQQAIGRVWRQGQTKPVTVTTLISNDTLDDVVVARVEGNARWMELFKQHLKG
jgi:SNF2 family DNA or RNA helicase